MPERPKRRKNKNKRKNKNNRHDCNTSSGDVNNSVNTEQCSAQSSNVDPDEEHHDINSLNEPVINLDHSNSQSNQTQNISINNCVSNPGSNQDLNNNSNDIHAANILESNPILDLVEGIQNTYVVESPEQLTKNKPKLGSNLKSKSLDNDDAPKIVEITESEESNAQFEDDNALAIIDSNNVVVSDAESDVEWENTNDFEDDQVTHLKELATGTLSITTIPLNFAQCDQTKSLTPEAERSLRHYLQTLNLATEPAGVSSIEINTEIEQIINREIRHRLRKKGLTEDFLSPRLGPPRILDVIDEEGSGESSVTSRRHSRLSDKKSDNEDLEDDVFEDKDKFKDKYSTKSVSTLTRQTFGRQIPQKCLLVGAKIKEPEVSEARGDWTIKTVEQMTGAEVVYLTDSSSSTSSIHEFGEETDDGEETDVSVRMITPTIEVTDTEILLKKTFSPKKDGKFETDQIDSKKSDLSALEYQTNTDNGKNADVKDINENNDSSPNVHEIIVLSTDDIKTNLYVKDLEDVGSVEKLEAIHKIKEVSNTEIDLNITDISNTAEIQKEGDKYDLEIKVLKCELNDAINNLIKEVVSDPETSNDNPKDSFARQDSSSSVSSSQCTAKYNPNYSSLNDISNILHDEIIESNKVNTDYIKSTDEISHVKDVFECVTGTTQINSRIDANNPLALRDLCVRKIAKFPYGDKILEELASVSQRLQNITILGSNSNEVSKVNNNIEYTPEDQKSVKMPYFPLPDVSTIETVSLEAVHKYPVPPPVQPRHSSLKKSQDEHHWTALPTKSDPVYVCLSPSQKMLMEKTNTVVTKEDATQLVDMHKKYVDRRGYNEYYGKEKKTEEEHVHKSPVIPFKSQTGSRLLALIRDPAVTSNINSVMNKHNRNVDQADKSYAHRDKISNRLNDQLSSIKEFSSNFKPIPPPRPRKYSSSFYESDESSDFTDNSFRSMKSEKKFFHYSTGNLSKEIEKDVSSIQNMHRYVTNYRDQVNPQSSPRRPSLPKDICDQQMEYIRLKEKEVQAEIERLEQKKLNVVPEKRSPKAPLITDKEIVEERNTNNDYFISRKRDFALSTRSPEREKGKLSIFSSSQEEILRDKMYTEYINQMAERQERKQHKVIKITNYPATTGSQSVSKSMSALDILDTKVNNRIEKEFISKARERWDKLGIKDPETEDEKETTKDVYREPKVVEHKIKVIEGGEERDVKKLPSHLQDFVRFTAKDKEQGTSGSGESNPGPASPHVVVLCAVIILVLAVGKYFLRFFRSK